MTGTILKDDIFQQIADMQAQIKRLQQFAPEDVHYIGASGEPSFQHSWVNYDNGLSAPSSPPDRSAGFYKHDGRVWLSGIVKSGASGSVVFTLPDGYRPGFDSVNMLAFADGATAFITPMANGDVIAISLTGNVSTYVELFSLSFRHA